MNAVKVKDCMDKRVRHLIKITKFMSAKFRVPKSLCFGGAILAFSMTLLGQTNISVVPQGGEFSILGGLPGDQVLPSLSLSPVGGCIAWQDNVIDHNGQGIGASILSSTFTAGPQFRVNRTALGDQINPQVQVLANDMMVFVWQSSVSGTPYIYARFTRNPAKDTANYEDKFTTADRRVNTYTTDQQIDPAVAGLPDGSAIITWSSYGEDGSLWGVYARRLTYNGGKGQSPKQFQVNQYTAYNQRNPAVTVLANGDYVIAWVSENESGPGNIDIYARVFTPDGVPVTDETMLDSIPNPVTLGTNVCASPSLAPTANGGFTAVWAEKDSLAVSNSWDIWGRAFAVADTITPLGPDFRVNTFLYGDQYVPKIAAAPSGSLVVWTSLGQDGSREGVFGRLLAGGMVPVGTNDIQVNTTTISQQMHPTVAWNGAEFLVAWTSFVGQNGFDLYGQAYVLNSP